MSHCPTCNKQFPAAGGFCPYDGTTLKAGSSSGPGPTAPRLPQPPRAETYESLIGLELDDRYRIEKQIGEGGMGYVFLARHIVIEKPVAIKVLKREVARDKAVITRFVQEARAASRIGHPNIVDVTDFGTTPDGLTYQVMEYIEGQTLNHTVFADGPLRALRAIRIAAQIAKALAAAHHKGIVHRDLKPENVFVTEHVERTDFVKIVDFGIAKVAGEKRLTQTGAVFGTPEYMSPEQAAGRNDTDHRVDVYALGIILYEMLVGRVPLKGETTVRTIAMQIIDPIMPPTEANPKADVSADLERVIMRCLEKRREDRFQSMGDLLVQLERLADELEEHEETALSPRPAPLVAPHPSTDVEVEPPTAVLEHLERARVATASRRRKAGDPEFLVQGSPSSFELGPDGSTSAAQSPGGLSRRWLVAIAAFAVLGGVGVSAALMLGSDEPKTALVTPSGPADAAAAIAVIDAAAAALPIDSGPVQPDAAARRPHRPGRPPISGRPDAAVAALAPGDRLGTGPEVSVTVTTTPEGGLLYQGRSYAGKADTGGVTIQRPRGTRLKITCKKAGYASGVIRVKFEEKQAHYECKLRRRKTKCIDGVKNPFGDCP